MIANMLKDLFMQVSSCTFTRSSFGGASQYYPCVPPMQTLIDFTDHIAYIVQAS